MSEITLPIVIAGTSLVFTALNYINMHYNENAKLKERLISLEESVKDAKLKERIAAIEEAMKLFEREAVEMKKATCTIAEVVKENTDKIVRLETKMELFWNSMSDMAADILHKPHKECAEMDSLLEKWKDRTISIKELERLKVILCELVENRTEKKTKGDVFWASFMVARINAFLADTTHSMNCLTAKD